MIADWRDKRVLVTGGAGFIGSYLVEQLVERGARVRVIDNFERGRLDNLDAVRDDVEVIDGDLRELATAEASCRGMDVVLHLASKAYGLVYSGKHHGEMLSDNLMLNTNVLEASRRAGVGRVLATSSSCVYPDDAVVPTPETAESVLAEPERVNAGYGWAKRMLELQARYYHQEYGMDIAIARPFNAYGPRDHYVEGYAHVLPSLVMRVLRGENPIVVWGSGNQTRSFVHAKDFATGLRLVAEKAAAADPINVGHDSETTIRQLIMTILDLTGESREVVFDTSKPEGATRKSCDPAKLRAVTGFVPKITLEKGLAETIDFYRTTAAEVVAR
ncbi:MAG TPA: NAD-dependent epimerase/dehydratase family protein [Thermoanaerobaculia bacterium]|jgi:nucleoside-diphosphate-sugar epimerase